MLHSKIANEKSFKHFLNVASNLISVSSDKRRGTGACNDELAAATAAAAVIVSICPGRFVAGVFFNALILVIDIRGVKGDCAFGEPDWALFLKFVSLKFDMSGTESYFISRDKLFVYLSLKKK